MLHSILLATALLTPQTFDPLEPWPTAVGTKWTYEITLSQPDTLNVTTKTWVMTVTRVKNTNTGKRVVLEIKEEDQPVQLEVIELRRSGVYDVHIGVGTQELTLDPPLPLVLWPATEGKTFKWKGRGFHPEGGIARIGYDSTIKRSELLTPWGKRKTIFVSSEVDFGKRLKGEGTCHMVPGIGIVHQSLSVKGKRPVRLSMRLVATSFMGKK